jgi:hypothetical protein
MSGFRTANATEAASLIEKENLTMELIMMVGKLVSNLQSAGISLHNSKEYMTHHAKIIRLIKSEIVDAINLCDFF